MNKLLLQLTFLLLTSTSIVAQPTIDGSSSGESAYTSLATWTQADTGFGDFGITSLKGHADATDLYIMVDGTCEDNFNDIFIFLNASSAANAYPTGVQLPTGSDNLSPFSALSATLDFDVNYGIRLTHDFQNPQAFVSIIKYSACQGGCPDEFLGTIVTDGTPLTASGTSYDGIQIAYDHSGNLSSNNGNQGFELKIPLSVIEASAGDDFQLFAMYGNDDFISANTLPEIPGQSGTNLGSNPDLTAPAADLFTAAAPLPVTLSSFDAIKEGRAVAIKWSTATEQNNDYFEVQRSTDNDWTRIATVRGAGDSYNTQNYIVIDENPIAGQSYYRLKQVDFDGRYEYSATVSVVFNTNDEASIYPNPASNNVFVNIGNNSSIHQVEVYSLDGKMLIQKRVGDSELLAVDVSNLSDGMKFIVLRDAQGALIQQSKFVKQ